MNRFIGYTPTSQLPLSLQQAVQKFDACGVSEKINNKFVK